MPTADLAPALRAYIEERMLHYNVPGVSVGVARPGEPELFVGVGVTNMRAPLEVNEHTLFQVRAPAPSADLVHSAAPCIHRQFFGSHSREHRRCTCVPTGQIGSTTKTFTALACAMLVDRGLLDLDTPLVELCPDFRLPSADATRAVTVKMLLNHTGGWDGDVLLVEPVGGRNDDALAQLPAYMEGIVEQLTAPGSLFHYNNTGFSLAGRVIEVVSGVSYEEFVEEEIFKPLGMAGKKKTAHFFPRFILKHDHVDHVTECDMIILPRQAWDKHRENLN
jgi:CubicO group peptidase (beta-lactamase class C family)